MPFIRLRRSELRDRSTVEALDFQFTLSLEGSGERRFPATRNAITIEKWALAPVRQPLISLGSTVWNLEAVTSQEACGKR